MYFEIANATVILTNSLGWKLKSPKLIHDCAPFTVFPIKNKDKRVSIENT